MAGDDLHAVACTDVVFDFFDTGFKRFLAEAAGGFGFAAAQGKRDGAVLPQLDADVFEAGAGALVCVGLARVGVNDKVDFAAEVVDNGQLFGEHHEDVRRADAVGFDGVFQTACEVFEVIDGFVAEIADEAAGEARQAGDFGRVETLVEGFDKFQRVAPVLFDNDAVFIQADFAAGGFDVGVRAEADEGVAAEAFAADDGFEQVGVGAVGEFEVDGQRGIQVGQQLLHEGDAVVAGGGLGEVLLFANHGFRRPLGVALRGRRKKEAV
ncbi:hypothetical protein HMPREF9120_02525 [Neisseria sp. oral taxon 020 str. F0370]|nr:hypothetical protein HMPREF9120_02525 [Neisseria sp. oral taxon 020 str. F0370]